QRDRQVDPAWPAGRLRRFTTGWRTDEQRQQRSGEDEGEDRDQVQANAAGKTEPFRDPTTGAQQIGTDDRTDGGGSQYQPQAVTAPGSAADLGRRVAAEEDRGIGGSQHAAAYQ